jgi:acetyl-CoA carboxylase carboxyltransferase component
MSMSWQPELDELRLRESLAQQMGGPDKVQRQHRGGRLTVRERVAALVDAGSFHEIGGIAGRASYDAEGKLTGLVPANCIFGRALIDGRPVMVCGDDFTVRGGSADATIKEKTLMAEQMAHEFRLPIVRVIEGSGGGGSVKTIETTGRANLPGRVGGTQGYYLATINMGAVPVVALGLGSVAGLGAARLAASHYSVMTKATSAMFVAGPPVVERIGQKLTKQELGVGNPDSRRCRRSRRRLRGGGLRLRSPLPLLSTRVDLRHAAGQRLRGRSEPPRREAARHRAQGSPARLQDASHH